MIAYGGDSQIKKRLDYLIDTIPFDNVKKEFVEIVISKGAKTRAIARIYSFPRVHQIAFNLPPRYTIEIISEKFFKLSSENQDKVLIHELLHIPKTFSGALVPHKCFGRKVVCQKAVDKLYDKIASAGSRVFTPT